VYLPGGKHLDIPSVKPTGVLDPTGCGDAYRAGLLYGLARDWPFEATGRLAALLGAIKVAHRGTQNHRFTPASLRADYRAAFGHALPE
jgi:adenosine kinase